MRRHHGVARERAIPRVDPRRELAIAFAAGRREVPFVALALRQGASVSRLDFRQGQAFPLTVSDLDQSRVDLVVMRLKSERSPQDLHGLTRALERAGNIFEMLRLAAFALEQIVQQDSAFRRLAAAMRVEHVVAPTLQPALTIEIGFAVSDVIEDGHARFAVADLRHRSATEQNTPARYSLPTTMSGASGCFMPTI